MHLLRLLLTGASTLREAHVPVQVVAHRNQLLAVKRGEMPWADVDTWRKKLPVTSNTPWPKRNCQNAPTTKWPIVSLSKHGGKWQTN